MVNIRFSGKVVDFLDYTKYFILGDKENITVWCIETIVTLPIVSSSCYTKSVENEYDCTVIYKSTSNAYTRIRQVSFGQVWTIKLDLINYVFI